MGSKLRSAIRESGLTHYRLARLAGMTATMIDRYMSGLSVQSDTIDRLCAVMYRGVKLQVEKGNTLEGAKHLIAQRLSNKHGDDWILDHVDHGARPVNSRSESVDGLLLVFRRRKN
jgi:transcriptional regulator with XRE-family HTH domain